MKLLVTGGAGFIGANFCLYWVKKYREDLLINLDSLTYAGNLDSLDSIKDCANYRFVKGDICDKELVNKLVAEVDTIVHFAAESHVDRSIIDPDPFIQTNVVGTGVLLAAAKKHNLKRFHHISTDEVFGQLSLGTTDKFNEDTCYNPRSPYAASKAAADHLVRAYYTTYGLPITISNCSNNFGPFQFPEKLISLAITNILEGKKVPLYGDGLYVRDWLYVEDHVKAIECILQKGKVGETYFVGGQTDDVANIDIIKKIVVAMGAGEDVTEYVTDRPGHDRRYAIDWSKIQRELGWKSEYDFDKGLQLTIDWYKQNTAWWEKIKSGEYKNYYEKQYTNR